MIQPRKLRTGDAVCIIAPSCTLPSMPWMTDELFAGAKRRFEERGFSVVEAKNLRSRDSSDSSDIRCRVDDVHEAFRDPAIAMLHCIRGGWNANQLLPYLDYDLIARNPKIFCGFSDITALGNAIYARTGLVTYSGPNFNQFAFGEKLQYSYDRFWDIMTRDAPIALEPSDAWTDDYFSAEKPWTFQKNEGWWTVQEGEAEGTAIGGNLCTMSLLQGTSFMPRLEGSILFVEDDHETHPRTFDRDLQSLTQQKGFDGVRGVIFGRFQMKAVNADFGPVTKERLLETINRNAALRKLPIIANADFGHTYPSFTFPIGGTVRMHATKKKPSIALLNH